MHTCEHTHTRTHAHIQIVKKLSVEKDNYRDKRNYCMGMSKVLLRKKSDRVFENGTVWQFQLNKNFKILVLNIKFKGKKDGI